MTTNVQKIAEALYDAFETDTRDDGTEFVKLKDGSPEWMSEAARAAHDAVDEMPDDAVYECIKSAASYIHDNDHDSDSAHEFADGEVSVYNAARVAWLAEKPLIRGPLCDEAAEETGWRFDGDRVSSSGIFGLIACGWYEWARRIYDAIAEACEAQADEMEDEETDEGDEEGDE